MLSYLVISMEISRLLHEHHPQPNCPVVVLDTEVEGGVQAVILI